MKRLFPCFALAFLVISCGPKEDPFSGDDPVSSVIVNYLSVESSNVEQSSATLSATIDISGAKESSHQAYFYCSSSANQPSSIQVEGERITAGGLSQKGGSINCVVRDLKANTLYYYIASVVVDGNEYFSDAFSFSTPPEKKELTITGDVSDITETSAIMFGYANLTPDLGEVTMGIIYSLNENPNLDNGVELTSKELDGNNQYFVTAKQLLPNTKYYYKSFVKVGGVYRSGEIKSFTTKDFSASVTTNNATNVGLYTCVLNGSLSISSIDNLNPTVGFIYSDSASTIDELIQKGQRIEGTLSSDGSFSCEVKGLSYGKQYFFIAGAIIQERKFIGELLSFNTTSISATVQTLDAEKVGLFSATLNGIVKLDNAEKLNIKTYFSYSDTPKSREDFMSGAQVYPSTLMEDGSFSKDVSGLQYATFYYYIAIAEIEGQYFWGEVKTFCTDDINASVETLEANSIGLYSSTLNGKCVINNEESLNKDLWFVYSETEETLEGLLEKGKRIGQTKYNNDEYSSSISSLKPFTKYYYAACAKVYDKSIYGSVLSFTTDNYDVSLSTDDATDIGMYSGTLNGELIIHNSEQPYASVWFLYSSNESASNKETLIETGKKMDSYRSSDGSFYVSLKNLPYATTFYYLACARIDDTLFYGDLRSFSTDDIMATLSISDASKIKLHTCVINGSLVVANKESLSKQVWVKYSATDETREEIVQNGTEISINLSQDGTFSTSITDLNHTTKYNYLAIAKVKDKFFYSDVKSFNTNAIPVGAVDMGTTVAWAECNIGASSREEYGDYYAWGETETKENYSWSTYKWCEGTELSLTKYNGSSSHGKVDNKAYLEKEDDVAYVKLGEGWRMPTQNELLELMYCGSWSWTSINGINGYLVTSSKTGNTLFLPAAGLIGGTTYSFVGVNGYYRSRQTTYASGTVDWGIWTYYLFSGDRRISYFERESGNPVRAVFE